MIAPDLAVTKLLLEVDNRYSAYGRCNICDANGTDNHGNNSCTPGAYLLRGTRSLINPSI